MAIQIQNSIFVSSDNEGKTRRIVNYVVDTTDDIAKLPTTDDIAQGSTAFVITGGLVYMKNGNDEWVVI